MSTEKNVTSVREASSPSIQELRTRIDQIDTTFMELWRERAELSRTIGALRLREGGTRLVLSREAEILRRFRSGIGSDGVQLGMLVLRAGRGRLAAPPSTSDLAVNETLAAVEPEGEL